MKNYLYYLLIAVPAIIVSCNSNTSVAENETICDCVELDAQRGADGKKVKNRGHIMFYKDSLYTGKCISYHLDNETKRVELLFKNGLMNGEQTVWDEEGNKILEAPMSQGQFNGTFKEWDNKGNLITKREFKGNKATGLGYYFSNSLDKDLAFVIFSLNESYDVGYWYPNFFMEEYSNPYDETIKMGWGSAFGSENASIKLEARISVDGYNITGYDNKISEYQNRFEEILKEFHENNPNINIEITRLGTYGFEGSSVNATGSIGRFDHAEILSPDYIEFCYNLENKFDFIKIHPGIEEAIEMQKEHFAEKNRPKKERELTDFEKEWGQIGFD